MSQTRVRSGTLLHQEGSERRASPSKHLFVFCASTCHSRYDRRLNPHADSGTRSTEPGDAAPGAGLQAGQRAYRGAGTRVRVAPLSPSLPDSVMKRREPDETPARLALGDLAPSFRLSFPCGDAMVAVWCQKAQWSLEVDESVHHFIQYCYCNGVKFRPMANRVHIYIYSALQTSGHSNHFTINALCHTFIH